MIRRSCVNSFQAFRLFKEHLCTHYGMPMQARAKVASALKQLDIAGAMLDAVSETLISCPHKMVDVAEDLLFLGKDYLKEESGQASALALRYLERAYEISSCATTASADSAAFTEKAIALRITSLRFS